jgi:hypothetical protein
MVVFLFVVVAQMRTFVSRVAYMDVGNTFSRIFMLTLNLNMDGRERSLHANSIYIKDWILLEIT